MLNLGMMEILLVLAVAFLVVGPKDLPKVARWIARQVKSIKKLVREIKKETGWDEFAKEFKDVADDEKSTVKDADIRKDVQSAADELQYKNDEQARRIAELEEEKKLLEISAGEARRLATDIATASQNASDANAEKEAVEVEEPVVVVEKEIPENDMAYPELDEVLKKAKELEQLLEEKSIKGEK